MPAAQAADPTAEQQAKALSAVPKDAQKYYGGYWYASDIIANPFSDWKPHPPPWQICHNDSYLGNSWRANLVAELRALTKQLADQGLAKPDLNVTNSNGDINLELTQLKAQIAQGCDIIMSYPGSATGLCSGIKEAYDKGILFVTIDSTVTCPEALNVATNPYYRGQFEGDWIAKQLNGKGNVIVMNGQPGTANTVAQESGFRQAVAPYPGIKVAGSLFGMWTGSVAKSEVLKFLATHPQPIQAAFSTGNMGVGIGQAFEQSGRPIPIITEVTNLCSLLAYWKEKKLTANTFVQDGGPMAYAAFIPALHMMAGQKPKVSTIFMPLPSITAENFNDYYDPSMTVQSTCFANGKDLHLVPDAYFDQFFTGGQPRAQVKIVAKQ
ncbi:substrate-binding domain-containing protein [Labrys monachus]|uniref:ABC-type sugar transport system substrate-binding protein n=1 Tax=Labrys monachus TaxID=217067 RepID=A0ABU0FG66_9HYPH|nr:substrate-binding domain-containing protein [Labrys monachus]MDQ0393612.1 ABC-type sugar transport system substrate-binding protein [Labrys monachus]